MDLMKPDRHAQNQAIEKQQTMLAERQKELDTRMAAMDKADADSRFSREQGRRGFGGLLSGMFKGQAGFEENVSKLGTRYS